MYSSFVEWHLHKYVLHGIGKKKGSSLQYHWARHHKIARKNQMMDEDYISLAKLKPHPSSYSEIFSVVLLCVVHLPLFWVSQPLYWACLFYACGYYTVHVLTHVIPGFAKKYVPWHYWHHMGKNQNMNWNVFLPIADIILRTAKAK